MDSFREAADSLQQTTGLSDQTLSKKLWSYSRKLRNFRRPPCPTLWAYKREQLCNVTHGKCQMIRSILLTVWESCRPAGPSSASSRPSLNVCYLPYHLPLFDRWTQKCWMVRETFQKTWKLCAYLKKITQQFEQWTAYHCGRRLLSHSFIFLFVQLFECETCKQH